MYGTVISHWFLKLNGFSKPNLTGFNKNQSVFNDFVIHDEPVCKMLAW
jgi:hypothetical protein